MDQKIKSSSVNYGGMTFNERLFESGLYDEYYRLLTNKENTERIIQILKKVQLTRGNIINILKHNDLYSPQIDYCYCMSDGQRADINQDYLEAVRHYEKECGTNELLAEALPNLAYLYWCASGLGPYSHQIPELQLNRCDALDKLNSLLDYGVQVLKYNCMSTFWRIYYMTEQKRNPITLSENEWLMIIERFANLHPAKSEYYFVCYRFDKNKYNDKIDDFLTESENCPTAKNLFIKEQIIRYENEVETSTSCRY